MRAFLWTLAVAAAVRPQGALVQQQNELELDSSASRESPVQKVVGMLNKMKDDLEADLKEDEATYHRTSCWCNDNSYEKEEAISAAEAKMKQLNADIEEGTAKSEQLKAEIKKLKEEIAANKEALGQAQAVREKELADFRKSDTECSENAQSLKAAITVLSKHHAEPAQSETEKLQDAFTYNGQGSATAAGSANSAFLQAGAKIDIDSLSKLVSSHSDADTASKVISAIQAPSYGAQSGEILGILKQMLEDMDGDCASAAEEEAAKAKAFAELKEAKTEEIKAGEKMADEKDTQLASTLRQLAEDKEDLDDTSAQHQEDIDFLNKMKETCGTLEEDWNKREAVRNEEIKAVSETIQILTSDAARDSFHGTFGHGQRELTEEEQARADAEVSVTNTNTPFNFIQTSMADRRARAAAKLSQFKEDPQMAMLATSVQLDAFTKVKQAITDMIAQLKVQKADGVKHNDFCTKSLQDNELETVDTRNLHEDQQAQKGTIEANIQRLATELKEAHKMIETANMEMQKATNTHTADSKKAQKTFNMQKASEKILRFALARMNKFYQAQQEFVQTSQTPPEMAKTYSPSAASSPVIGLIEGLIVDALEMAAETIADAVDQREGYIAFVAGHNANVKTLQSSIVSKNKEKADQEQALGQTKEDIKATMKNLEGLGDVNARLHTECDFAQKNFNKIQDGLQNEIQGLQEAMQILSGAM